MLRTLFPLALVAMTFAACGKSTDDPPSAAEAEEQALKFARCMRENGIDMPDPQTDADGRMTQRIGGPGVRIDPARMEKAMEACREFEPTGGRAVSPADEQEFRDRILEFTQCMRENGVNMPDPQFEGGGRVIMRERRGAVNPESPTFRKAQEACREFMPEGPGGP